MVEYSIGNQYRHLDYIYAEGRVVALHVKNGNADSLYYVLTDHLGSWNKGSFIPMKQSSPHNSQ